MNDPAPSTDSPADIPAHSRTGKGAETIRWPSSDDGLRIWQLIADTASLDGNSLYCNLLQCSDFASTCAIAEADGAVMGWMSGYVPPDRPDTLFVWQICVVPEARGRGLAVGMIREVLSRDACTRVTQVQATITDGNNASWSAFESLSRALDAPLQRVPHFLKDRHFGGVHDTEFLVSVGPFSRRR